MKINKREWFIGISVVNCILQTSILHGAAAFSEVTATGDLANAVFGNGGSSWGDFDGDGDMDLFITMLSDEQGNTVNMLYRNDGEGAFTRMDTTIVGELGDDRTYSRIGLWADLDNDGDCDLYVVRKSIIQGTGQPTEDVIYSNNGQGKFKRILAEGTGGSGAQPNCGSLVDFDQDGDLDVSEPTYSTIDGTIPDLLFENKGGFRFSQSNVPTAPGTFANSISWADFDTDGDMDAVVANQSGRSYLFINSLKQTGALEFAAEDQGGNVLGMIFAASGCAAWGDMDNDSDLDLITAENDAGLRIHRRMDDERYEPLPHVKPGGRGVLMVSLVDIENDGDLDLITTEWDNREYRLLMNNGDGTNFAEEVLASPLSGTFPRPVTVGDFNNDGYMDAAILYIGRSPCLFQNNGGSNHWLKLVLKGTVSNASAIGAIVRVKATMGGVETWQMRQITAGGQAWRTQHDIRPNFGLRDATVADIVRIEWPSGTVQELSNVASDQILDVVEPPRLRVESGGQLSWPVTAEGYRLESTISIGGSWADATETVRTSGSRKSITIQADGEAKFYRLHQP